MRDRGRKSSTTDINCWAIMVGSLEFEGSTDFGIDTEFRAGIGLGPYRWTFWKSAITSPKTALDRYSYCPWIMTKWVVCCDKSKKFNQEESVYMTDLRTHVYSKFYLPSGICNSCWDQSILQLNTEKECLRFSRSWRKWAITDGCQKEVEYTQQRQGTEWMGERLSEKSYRRHLYKRRK